MAKREFLMLAHKYDPKKHAIGGWFASEKLDGMRCFWDGGISRGKLKNTIPWANIAKDTRYKEEQVATGLWSRYGNVIHAPDAWLDTLPRFPMDGELWMGYAFRQNLMTIVKKNTPDETEWRNVEFFVFDLPSFDMIFSMGVINTTNFKKRIDPVEIELWIRKQNYTFDRDPYRRVSFADTYHIMQIQILPISKACTLNQEQLPFAEDAAQCRIDFKMADVLENGGEGIVLRKPESIWLPERSWNLLKVKPFDDAEGTVIGYITGRQTTLGSKLLGMMGSLVLQLENGKTMELSGFTDEERRLEDTTYPIDMGPWPTAYDWAINHPGENLPDNFQCSAFPRGSKVSFKYRGLTADGIPMEARYWRKRDEY